jgi:hypothetical protein
VWSLVFGIGSLIAVPRPAALDFLPGWAFMVWSIGLTISGVIGLTGCIWRWHVEFGLLVESAGLLIGAGALLMPLTGAFMVGGNKAAWAGGIYATWALMNIVRVYQVHRDLDRLRTAEQMHAAEEYGAHLHPDTS